MKKIFIMMIISSLLLIPSSNPIPEVSYTSTTPEETIPEETVSYTSTSETHCSKNNECYRINYNDTEFKYDEKHKKWNKLNKAEIESTEYWNDKGFDKLDVEVNASYPKIRLWRWNKEDYLDIEFPVKAKPLSKGMHSPKLTQEYSGFNVSLYPLWNFTENGGFEFEIVLKQKPKTNKFTFSINDSGLEFYYQPPLYEQYGLTEPNSTCNATDCGNSHRPENIVDSYAVYHSSKKNNKYRAGKLFHIYRPKIIDSEGKEAWAKLNIDKGKLTIEIPQDFLDKANYPVTIDPTFGYDTIGGSDYDASLDRIIGSWFTLSEDGTAESITFYLHTDSYDDGPRKLGIYRKSDDSFVIGTDEYSGETPDAWIKHDLTASTDLTSGDYWLVHWGEEHALRYDIDETEKGGVDSESYPGTWPDPWSPAFQSYKYSIYCTYSAAGDTTPPTYSLNSTNSTTAGTPVLHSLKWTDETGLATTGGYIFSFDNCTGSFVNDTWTAFSSNPDWSNVTKTINDTVGCTIRWKVYANDTSDNWNASETFSYTTTSAVDATFSIAMPSDYTGWTQVTGTDESGATSIDWISFNIFVNRISWAIQLTTKMEQ